MTGSQTTFTAAETARYMQLLVRGRSICAARSPNTDWVCTRAPGHSGIHVAHGYEEVLEVWPVPGDIFDLIEERLSE